MENHSGDYCRHLRRTFRRSRCSDLDVKDEHESHESMENTRFKISQYACAVLLIVSSIALVAYQVVSIEDVAAGLLYYVAQSFLLAGSIFGLDQYIKIIKRNDYGKHKTQ